MDIKDRIGGVNLGVNLAQDRDKQRVAGFIKWGEFLD
jgi:hypothetical protein